MSRSKPEEEKHELIQEVERVNRIAEAVVDLSAAMEKLKQGMLNEKALIVLISHSSGHNQKTCKEVLNSLETLAKTYVKADA